MRKILTVLVGCALVFALTGVGKAQTIVKESRNFPVTVIAPTLNTSGDPLLDLAELRVYGIPASNPSQRILVGTFDNPGIGATVDIAVTVPNTGVWNFVATAVREWVVGSDTVMCESDDSVLSNTTLVTGGCAAPPTSIEVK